MERTLSIIKPDAVSRNLAGAILKMIQDSGLRVVALKMIQLTKAQAEGFYAVHKERPFFGSLVDFMISGPVVVSILEGDNAIARYRTLMLPLKCNPNFAVRTIFFRQALRAGGKKPARLQRKPRYDEDFS